MTSAADRLADSLTDLAGPGLRSVILSGSLAAGGFRPGRSDIDLVAVVDGGLDDARAAAIERMVRDAEVGSAAGIDLHVVTTEVAGVPTEAPPLELRAGRYDLPPAGFEVERRLPADPDLPAELSMARAHGRSLRGAEPRVVLGPVPDEWVVSRGRHWLTAWQSLTDDTENAAFMVLTACRMWHFAAEHEYCSKARAAEWALDRDPSLAVVRQALLRYEREPSTPVDPGGLAKLLEIVLSETRG